MRSHRSLEGELTLDHRYSPGVPDEIAVRQGLTPGAGKGLFESATITCHRCQAVVVLNPNRSRERAYCKRHDHFLCDACAVELRATGEQCVTWLDTIEEFAKRLDAGKSTADVRVPLVDPKPQPQPEATTTSIIVP